jgi:flagellar M-ring protein FliF
MIADPAPIGPDGKPGPTPAPHEQKRSPQELETLRQIVINALGIKINAGQTIDSVTLQEQKFEVPDLSAAQAPMPIEARVGGWVEDASRWAAVGGAVLVLLAFWRLFKRQKPEPVPIEVLAMTPDQASGSLTNTTNVTPELLNELIRQKPANIGVALREWVTAGAGNVPASKN